MVGGVGGGVHVSVRFHRGPGCIPHIAVVDHPSHGWCRWQRFFEKTASTASHDSGLHFTNHLASSIATTTVEEDPCLMGVMNSNPEKDGWFAHHLAPSVTRRRTRLSREPRQSPRLTALVPHPSGAVAGVHRRWGHVYEWLRVLHVSLHLQHRFGFARRVPSRTLRRELSLGSA